MAPRALRSGRPRPVGADHVGRGDGAQPVDVELDPAGDGPGPGQGVPVGHLHAGGTGHVEQGGVELGPGGDDGVEAVVGQRERHRAAHGRAHEHLVHGLPVGDGVGAQAQALQLAQGVGGEPVAAALVAGEAGLVDEEDGRAGPGQGDGRGGAGRPAAHDHDGVIQRRERASGRRRPSPGRRPA